MEIKIPDKLKQELEDRIKGTDFQSIQEYVTFILEQVTAETETEIQAYSEEEEADIAGHPTWKAEADERDRIEKEKKESEQSGYTEDEEEDLKRTLDDMGYI
jgi:Arc/MetJ-type ribon-helix-helix transcriptional regulator